MAEKCQGAHVTDMNRMPGTESLHAGATNAVLLITVLVTAMCLRAPITAIAPLFEYIQSDLGLSTTSIGLLTTLPLLIFAAAAPVSARLSIRYGARRCVFAALLLLAMSIAIRSTGSAFALFSATLLIGLAIAVANVLLPSIIKHAYPDNVGPVTAMYVLCMTAAAGIYSILVVPLAQLPGWNWKSALLVAIALPVAGAMLWLSSLGGESAGAQKAAITRDTAIWKSMIAWAVTLYFGLTVFIHYAAIAWLPAVLRDTGHSLAQAGALHGWMQFAGAVPGAALMPLLQRMKDQRLLAALSPALAAAGLIGLIVLPQWSLVWVLAMGIGLGAAFVLGLAFIGLRSSSTGQAASLSGMTQGLGYLLAALAPVLIAGFHSLAQSWTPPLAVLVLLSVVAGAFGLVAGRPNKPVDAAA